MEFKCGDVYVPAVNFRGCRCFGGFISLVVQNPPNTLWVGVNPRRCLWVQTPTHKEFGRLGFGHQTFQVPKNGFPELFSAIFWGGFPASIQLI